MDDVVIKRKEKISAAELERRRKGVRAADVNNRLAGQVNSAESAERSEAFVNGEIELHERKPKISVTEMQSRRRALEMSDAHNRIEGIFRGPETDHIFEAAVRGDIEVTDIIPLLKAQLGH